MDNTIGERIVFLREERDLSQKELAYSIDIAPTSLSRYENNLYEPKAEIISRLAVALNTTADFLLGLTDTYDRPQENTKISPGLTISEHRLISYYRKLEPENKIRIQERMHTLYDLQSKPQT